MRNALRRYVGRRVVIQVGEDSIGGVLSSADGGGLALTEAVLLEGGATQPLDGWAWVPEARVRWVQVT